MESITILKRRIDAAMGRIPCDLILKNARILDVFNCKFTTSEVAVFEGTVVAVEPGLKAKQTINLSGDFLVPGFIDAHVHVESSMMMPFSFDRSVLERGTTTAVCDPHEIANVMGVSGIEFFLEASLKMNLDLEVMLSSCVPATHLETNGGGTIRAKDLVPFIHHPKALGLAEMMNIPGVLAADSEILEKLTAFSGRPLDGHSPLLRGQDLSAYLCAGISSCHESSELEEAEEKIRKGMSVWIREGSVAKDVSTLAPLLTLANSTTVGFCTDDRNPLDIAEEGHIDYLIRRAIQLGIPAEIAFRSASWSPARHYGLDRGPIRRGAIAPGYQADFVRISEINSVAVHSVYKKGKLVSDLDWPVNTEKSRFQNTIQTAKLMDSDLKAPEGLVHVIEVFEGKIITGHLTLSHQAKGVNQLSVKERYGNNIKPANGYVFGFGENLNGAIASSVGHDSHNLISVGSSASDMTVAMNALIESGGGFSVVKNGSVLKQIALPLAGLMSPLSAKEIQNQLKELKAAARQIGCPLSEPFLQLAFLSLPVIPKLKLTDQGLVDVEKFQIISVLA